MYYESKNELRKEKIIVTVLMIVIIALLCIVIIKLDVPDQVGTSGNYNAQKLSPNSDKTVEKQTEKTINSVVKSVVGISNLKQNGSSIFLNDSENKLGLGSGIILTDNGYILTNQHVVGNKYSSCYVTLENGKVFSGSVIWADSNIDLAIVKIMTNGLEYIKIGDSDNINLADEVYAIGNPVGIEFQRTVTKGIISGINRTIKIEENGTSSYMEDLIQTDATINVGNSGGPLINQEGELMTKNIDLYVPLLEDYWYEQKIQADPLSMDYNAGYDVSYYGYHYDTGCIDFPEERWKETYEKRIRENRYFAYIKDNDINEFVGYVNYDYNKNDNRYECGIVIESKYRGKGYLKIALQLLCNTARSNGIKELYDNFEIDRQNTLNVFKSVGFEIVEEQSWKKFNKVVKGVLVKIVL